MRPRFESVHWSASGQPAHRLGEVRDPSAAGAGQRDGVLGRAGNCRGVEVDLELVLGKPPVGRGRRLGLGVDLRARLFEFVEHLAAAIGRVAIHRQRSTRARGLPAASCSAGLLGLGLPGVVLLGLGLPGVRLRGLVLLSVGLPGVGLLGLGLLGVGLPGLGLLGVGLRGLVLLGLGLPASGCTASSCWASGCSASSC